MAIARKSIRSDAFSSISRIVASARRAFAVGDGSKSLTKIATDAGVGVATLYRHFPNRRALALAVYEEIFMAEIHPLLSTFGDSPSPRLVLLEVAERLADVAVAERGMVASLGNIAEVTTEFLSRSMDSIAPGLARAQAAGTLRTDIVTADIPNFLAMITMGVGAVDTGTASRRRYLSLMLDALSPSPAGRLSF